MSAQTTVNDDAVTWNYLKGFLFSNYLIVSLLLVLKSGETASVIISAALNTTLVGQNVFLNCCSNNSPEINWHFVRGSNYSAYDKLCTQAPDYPCMAITSGGAVTDLYMKNYKVNHDNSTSPLICSTLSFDAANLSFAGTYRCSGGFGSKTNASLTLIDRWPNCVLSNNSEDFHLNCNFSYSGQTPKLQWKLRNSSDTATNCSEEYGVIILCSLKFPMFSHDSNISCLWDESPVKERRDSEVRTVDLLDINTGFVATLRCTLTVVECKVTSTTTSTATDNNSDNPGIHEETNFVLIVIVSICAVVGLAIIVTLLLHKCESKRNGNKSVPEITTQNLNEPMYSLAGHIDEDSNPMYSEVKNRKSSNTMPIYAEVKKNGKKSKNDATQHGHVIAETEIYGYALYEHDSADNEQEKAGQNSPSDRVIYSELQCVGSSDRTQRPVFVVREGFDRSDYVSVDHSFKAPPAPPHK